VAGLAVGYWSSREELRGKWAEDKRFVPTMPAETSAKLLTQWKKAVTRTFDWVD
jgi:glycerol kinase